MDLIVAVTADWGIGKDGDLLVHIPEDMKFFREKTKGAAVIMGRATLDSFPGGAPLKGRLNIVMTRNAAFFRDGVTVVHDIDQLFSLINGITDRPIVVIGGGEIYSMLLPYCERAYITKVDTTVPCDTFFPNVDLMENWKEVYRSEDKLHNGLVFRFTTYENTGVKEIKC